MNYRLLFRQTIWNKLILPVCMLVVSIFKWRKCTMYSVFLSSPLLCRFHFPAAMRMYTTLRRPTIGERVWNLHTIK